MRAEPEEDRSGVPTALERKEKREQNQRGKNRLRRAARGYSEHERIEKMQRGQEGRAARRGAFRCSHRVWALPRSGSASQAG